MAARLLRGCLVIVSAVYIHVLGRLWMIRFHFWFLSSSWSCQHSFGCCSVVERHIQYIPNMFPRLHFHCATNHSSLRFRVVASGHPPPLLVPIAQPGSARQAIASLAGSAACSCRFPCRGTRPFRHLWRRPSVLRRCCSWGDAYGLPRRRFGPESHSSGSRLLSPLHRTTLSSALVFKFKSNAFGILWSLPPFSKSNKMFFGYFDSENIFLDNENK